VPSISFLATVFPHWTGLRLDAATLVEQQLIDVHTPDAASIARHDSIPAGLTRKGGQENSGTSFSKDMS
jgi:hypothetical protein